MKRIDKVYQVLAQMCRTINRQQIQQGFEGFCTEDIAQKCGLQRSNTSRELNRLAEKGLVCKSLNRPVLYFDVERLKVLGIKTEDYKERQIKGRTTGRFDNSHEEDFSSMERRLPNLETAIQQGKAAMMYPPHGLHTLITGQSGVGKTFFAEAMFHFCKEEGLISENGKFVTFNCAEYANNPQLLLSNLFGYVKGAFTGADKETKGLIDQADKGMLFLDEVHRLPASGQELLFLLIDKGYFRRLGESEKKVTVDLRLVLATTENVEDFMLTTFRRRIPIEIHLPSLEEYGFESRLRLIELFFEKEAANIHVPVQVSGDVLVILLHYKTPGNIGQLKGDIQLTCAKAFLEMQGEDGDCMYVETHHLPELLKTFNISPDKNQKAKEFLKLPMGGYQSYGEMQGHGLGEDGTERLYSRIRQLYINNITHGYPKETILKGIQEYIDHYFNQISKPDKAIEYEKDKLKQLVGEEVYDTTETILKKAEQRLGKNFGQKVFIALALHISVLIERLKRGEVVTGPQQETETNHKEHSEECEVALDMLREASTRLGIAIPKSEALFFSMFLYAMTEENVKENVGLLLVFYGISTATSMSQVANSIFSVNLCRAVDIPLKLSQTQLLDLLKTQISQADCGRGVLVMTDMKKLAASAEEAGEQAGVRVRCISNANTATVIEAVKGSVCGISDLEVLYRRGRKIQQEQKDSDEEGKSGKDKAGFQERFLIVTCITGLGAAIKLGDMIREHIPEIQKQGIKILPVNKDGCGSMAYDGGSVLLVVGAVDLHLPEVPFISLDEIIMGQGYGKIRRILGYHSMENGNGYENTPVCQILSRYLSFIDPDKAAVSAERSFHKLVSLLPKRNLSFMKLRYIFHCACMVERALWGQQLSHEAVEELKREEKELFDAISEAMEELNEDFCIKIADTEIAYIVEMINTV